MQVATVHQIAALVRGRRAELGQTQEVVARQAGVSRKWLSDFERGATTGAELPLVLRVLAALALTVEVGPSKAPAPGAADPGETDLDSVLDRYRGTGGTDR